MRDPRDDSDGRDRSAPEDDGRLLDALRGVLGAVDPMPDRVLDAGRMSFALRELSALPVTQRPGGGCR
jgi:hypothetical protein